MHFARNLKISTKLFCSFSICLTAILLTSGVLVYGYFRNTIEFHVESELQNTTASMFNMVKASVDASIKNRLSAVAQKNREIVAYHYKLFRKGRLTESAAQQRARDILLSQTIGKTGYIYCVNSYGTIEAHPRAAVRGQDLSGYDFIQWQIKNKEGYLEYDWQNPDDKTPRPKALFMTYFEPWDWIISASSYRDEFSELVNVSEFRDYVLSRTFGKTGYAYILNKAGNIVIHPELAPNESILDVQGIDGRYFIRDMLQQKKGKIYYSWKNPSEVHAREKIVIYDHLPELGWIIASSSYLYEVYEPVAQLRNIFMSVMAFTLLTVFALSLWISRLITTPLNNLMQEMDKGAGGDFSARLSYQGDDETGQLAAYFNVFMDKLETYSATLHREIYEKGQTETALRESEAKHRAVLDVSPDPIVLYDAEGRAQYLNPAFTRIFGWSRDELLGKKIDFVPPQSTEATMKVIKTLYAGEKERVALETYRNTKDGRMIDVLISAGLFKDPQGNPIGMVSNLTDITQTKRAEKEIRQLNEDLELRVADRTEALASANENLESAIRRAQGLTEAAEAANRAKSEFLANMSHEIRTPMNGIIGNTALALDTHLTKDQEDFLQAIKTSADHLLGVINDILDFSKIEAGHLDLEQIDFRLRTTMENAVDTLAINAHEKDLKLNWRVAPEVPDYLIGDPGRLRQIIFNLLSNAIKFTPAGEAIVTCEVGKMDNTSVKLDFKVSDTGIGIPDDIINSIFDSFRQADGSTTRKYGGTGLGLSISKQLVEKMGGTIGAQSPMEPLSIEGRPVHQPDGQNGPGTTFHFSVRFGLQSDKPRQDHLIPSVDMRTKQVLIVDDHDTSRKILGEIFTSWKIAHVEMKDGERAMGELQRAVAAGKPYDIVVIDRQLGNANGFGLSAEIKADPGLANAIIIMITSVGQRGDVNRCRKMGLSGYLVKPVKQSEMLDAIMLAMTRDGQSDATHASQIVTQHTVHEKRQSPPLNILLAEDNHINQQMAVAILKKHSHRVTVADNGRKVMDCLAENRFDLVLMDVQMPVMDGIAATRAIRGASSEIRDMPIIAMTAHALKGDREKCLEAGMSDYLSKPIDPEKLFAVLAKWCPQDGRSDGSTDPTNMVETSADDSRNKSHHPESAIEIDEVLKRVMGPIRE